MNFKACYRHPMNRLALGFFIAALVCFVVFHVTRYRNETGVGPYGADIWKNLYVFVRFGFWRSAPWHVYLIISSFVMMSCLTVFAPTMVPFLSGNRLVWWLVTLISGISSAGFSVVPLCMNHAHGPPIWAIVACQSFHLLGCLCIRRPKPEEFVPAPHPDA